LFLKKKCALAFQTDFALKRTENRKRKIKILAELSGGIVPGMVVDVSSNNSAITVVGQKPKLKRVNNKNYSEAIVSVLGRQLGAKGNLTARVAEKEVKTSIQVVSKELPKGPPLDFKIWPEKFEPYRARWDTPNNPNLLIVSSQHPTVERYLGAQPDFEGQNNPHFKLLLAEIVAERVCQRALELKESNYPADFQAGQNFDVRAFYHEHNLLMAEFTPIAHRTLLTNKEMEQLRRDGKLV
jgi:hypothetical protein